MPAHPPRGYFPACIAPLYVLARALHEAHPTEGLPEVSLKPFSASAYLRPTASATHAGERRTFNLTVSAFKPLRFGVEVHLDLILQPRVVPRTLPPPPRLPKESLPAPIIEVQPPADDEDTDDEGEWPEETPEEAAASAAAAKDRAEAEERWSNPVAVMLVPPFETCLLSEHLSATARWRDLRALPRTARGGRTFPKDAVFRLPSVAARLIDELRNVLAAGSSRAVLLEPTGDETPVPARFWRSEAAEAVLAAEVDTVVPLENGRDAAGTIWFDEITLDAAWCGIRDDAAVYMKLPQAEPPAPVEDTSEIAAEDPKPECDAPASETMTVRKISPYFDFLLKVALDLNMTDGRDADGNKILAKDLQRRIIEMWEGRTDLGTISANKINMMVTMLRHPKLEKGGLPTQEEMDASKKATRRE